MCRHGKDRERKRFQHGKHALQIENATQSQNVQAISISTIIKGGENMLGLLITITKSYMMLPTTLIMRTCNMSSKGISTRKLFKPFF
jgi:hypothetical protein